MGIDVKKRGELVRLSSIVLFWVLLHITACNEFPNNVGAVMATDSVSATTVTSIEDTTIITGSKTALTRSVQFNTGNLYIGATATTRAATLLRFVNIPDSLKSLSESQIDSVRLFVLPNRYVFGDSINNTLEFNVVTMNKAWIINEADGKVKLVPRWNDLFVSGVVPNSTYFGSTLGTFNGQIPLKDTLSDISLSMTNSQTKSYLIQWFKDIGDTSSKGAKIYGIGLIPTSNSKVIREFNTRSTADQTSPLIRMNVYYRRPSDAGRDSLILLSGNDATFVDADVPDSTAYLTAQSLVVTQGEIYCDINSIPESPTIAKSQLHLFADTTMFQGGNYGLPKNIQISVQYGYDTTTKSSTYYAAKSATSNEYISENFGRVLEQARRDKAKMKTPGKITIKIFSNDIRLERSCFYASSNPDKNKRPRLVISYLTRPTFGGKK